MWETIGKALKVVFEKQLIPAVISVVAAIGVLLFLPADYWAITKLGKPLFLMFVAGGVFLLLNLIIYLVRKCGYFHAARKSAKENQQYEKAKELEKMRELWRNVDGLSPENRNLVKEFLKTDNKPIKIENTIFPYDSFLESDWFNSTEVYEPDTDLKPNHISVSPVGSVPPYPVFSTRLYKLNDQYYEILRYSWTHYGKICNFEQEGILGASKGESGR